MLVFLCVYGVNNKSIDNIIYLFDNYAIVFHHHCFPFPDSQRLH